jgi:hypothetical protein
MYCLVSSINIVDNRIACTNAMCVPSKKKSTAMLFAELCSCSCREMKAQRATRIASLQNSGEADEQTQLLCRTAM